MSIYRLGYDINTGKTSNHPLFKFKIFLSVTVVSSDKQLIKQLSLEL